MNNSHKAIILKAVFVWFAGSMLISGCSMERSCSMVTSGKVLVMDLTQKADYQQLLQGTPQTHGMRCGRVYLQPGESCGRHSTEAQEELLVFLAGKGIALIGEKETPYEVAQGKVCYIPPYTIHNNKNTGTEPLIYIYCVAPAR